jgi:hypothetical protein
LSSRLHEAAVCRHTALVSILAVHDRHRCLCDLSCHLGIRGCGEVVETSYDWLEEPTGARRPLTVADRERLEDLKFRPTYGPTYLILETKGYDPLQEVKEAAAQRWVAAVNADGQFGQWAFQMVTKVSEVMRPN